MYHGDRPPDRLILFGGGSFLPPLFCVCMYHYIKNQEDRTLIHDKELYQLTYP